MPRFDLGRRPYQLRAFAGQQMKLTEDIRSAVVFIGTGTEANFEPFGTGFLMVWKGCRYLVTAHHVIHDHADAPFSLRVNEPPGGGVLCLSYDPLKDGEKFPWFSPDDETVDLAVMPFNVDLRKHNCPVRYIPERLLLSSQHAIDEQIGVGHECHTVGLFRLLGRVKRNLPVVHTGNIALMAGEEPIPVKDWREDQATARRFAMDAYLIETLSLEGLSGSPVLVRPSFVFEGLPMAGGNKRNGQISEDSVLLLGVWHGAWKGDPDSTLARETGKWKVPVGMGIATPAQKLIDLFESPPVASARNAWLEKIKANDDPTPDHA